MGAPKSEQDAMQSLLSAAQAIDTADGYPPVEKWEPDFCGEMDLVIRRDGSWWHEGARIGREKLIRLFARILRKDENGKTYLVTPVEKIEIQVEAAPFVAIRLDVEGEGRDQKIAFLTNLDDAVIAGPDHPLRIRPLLHALDKRRFDLLAKLLLDGFAPQVMTVGPPKVPYGAHIHKTHFDFSLRLRNHRHSYHHGHSTQYFFQSQLHHRSPEDFYFSYSQPDNSVGIVPTAQVEGLNTLPNDAGEFSFNLTRSLEIITNASTVAR